LPQSIEGTVTASKPQTLEEATNIAQRLMDQIIKRGSVQRTNDHKLKFDDRRNTSNNNNCRNNNYQNNRNNDYRQQQNKRQETFRAYVAAPTQINRSSDQSVLEDKQQCPRKSILAEGQERSPRSERSHRYGYNKNHKKTAKKRTNMDTRNGRAQKKPKIQSQSQKKPKSQSKKVKSWSTKVNH
ncbi:hypothetical protein Tco_0696563, partial [Tanacetum coccineum]